MPERHAMAAKQSYRCQQPTCSVFAALTASDLPGFDFEPDAGPMRNATDDSSLEVVGKLE